MSAYTSKLVAIAQEQYDKFHLLREDQSPLSKQIALYWKDLSLHFPGVSVAWSAIFVSWCVQKAGATATEFQFSPQHSVFVYHAIQNARQNTGLFRGKDPSLYVPKIGDIFHNNRGGSKYDFQHAATHADYLSHSAIVIEIGTDSKGKYMRTIGGNEGDTVGMRELRLQSNGKVVNNNGLYISIIETLK